MDIIVYALIGLFVLYLVLRFSGLVKAYRPDDTQTPPPEQKQEDAPVSEPEPGKEAGQGEESGEEDSN